MNIRLFNRSVKISLFSIVIFVFFLLVSLVSLHVVRSKILENSHVMGQAIAALFATKETMKIKTQEMLLRSVAQNLEQILKVRPDWSEEEIAEEQRRFVEYIEANSEVSRFEMSAVIGGRLIGMPSWENETNPAELEWYRSAIESNGRVVYSNLYKTGQAEARVLTMSIKIGNSNDVVAMHIYPEKLNALLADNKLPNHSYYYLCDPNGNIMFTINERDLSLEEQQPYVDHIFSEVRKSLQNGEHSYITDYEGYKRGIYYAVSDKGWISIVTIPYNYLLGDYQNLLQWFIITLGIMLLLMLLLALRERMLNQQVEIVNEVVRVLGSSYNAIYRINLDEGKFFKVKAERFDGIEASESGSYDDLFKDVLEYVEPGAVDEFSRTFSLEHVRRLVENGVYDFGGEFRQRFGNEYRWVNVRLICDSGLRNGEAILSFREVDAEKQKQLEHMQLIERALRVAQQNAKSRNMFFSAMSHDMRAPLNGMIGMAELAALHKEEPQAVDDYVQKIKSAGKQLLTLINDILEMAKMENGKVEHLQEDFDIYAVVNDISALFEAQASVEKKQFIKKMKVRHEIVNGDVQALHQILNNVLSNSVKYTKEQGQISFEVRRGELNKKGRRCYCFVVRDTGCGMSEKFLEKIFTPFERDSLFGAQNVIGTGLGMTIVKSLVERMEGTILVESKLDVGTSVTITIPFTVVQPETVNTPETECHVQLKNFAGSTVLVAEDNDINMEIITELLQMNGLNVLQAANGQEAVEKFSASKTGSIDMVLMDIQMPVMGGCEAAKSIRGLEREDAAVVPIIALTGNAGAKDVEKAMQAGMNDYMVKPIQMKLLAKIMSEYIQADAEEDYSAI